MNKGQLSLLRELMDISFCLVETNLYLDTHPTDERALRLHNNFSEQYSELVEEYTKQYGPLKYTQQSGCPWEYIKGPWPWEIDYKGCK